MHYLSAHNASSLPSYSLRESRRAKQVRLRVCPYKGLEVIVPAGFDRSLLPNILHRNRGWIEGKLDAFALRERTAPTIPDHIPLRAVAEHWRVSVAPGKQPKLRETGSLQLCLEGVENDLDRARPLLRRWTAARAQQELSDWLNDLSRETRLTFQRLSIRGQRSRWGSCSSQRSISLNFKLLFLPPPLVRHVLIHELCHTVHLNHSQQFWHLVARLDPDHRHLRQELREAWRYMPDWLEP